MAPRGATTNEKMTLYLDPELIALHLMESPRLAQHLATYAGPANNTRER